MATAEVNGVELAYEVHGTGEPLVLICGTGQRADSWTALGTVNDSLEAGYQVITFDNRGMAPSAAPEGPYSVEMMADDAAALIEHLGLSDVRVAGISLGGFITFQLARSRPDLVRGAVCIAGLVGTSKYAELLMAARVEALTSGAQLPHALDTLLGLPTTFGPATVQNDDLLETMATFMTTVSPPWTGPGPLGQYQADVDWSRRSKEWQEQALAETAVPVLVIAHEFDVLLPPALLRWGADRLPAGQYLEIAGCGHAGIEDMAAHREALTKFFASL